MTSAFDADMPTTKEPDRAPVEFNYLANESETEDEEIRMTCMGGVRGFDDSDMHSTDDSECGDDALSEDESGDRYVTVTWVNSMGRGSTQLYATDTL